MSMKAKCAILLPLLLLSSAASTPSIEWQRFIGGAGKDGFDAMVKAESGRYLLAGMTTEEEDRQGWLVSIDEDGKELWNRSWGGDGRDQFRSLALTSDGGCIIAGITISYGGGRQDMWLVKVDENGRLEWDRTFGGPNDDEGWGVKVTSEGGYIVVGRTESYGTLGSDVWLVKADSLGRREWERTFPASGDALGRAILVVPGGYVIAGRAEQEEDSDLLLIKTDLRGVQEWSFSWGLPEHDEFANTIVETADGDFLLVGGTEYYSPSSDPLIVKVDRGGRPLWNSTMPGEGDDWLNAVLEVAEGLMLAGVTTRSGNRDLLLMKTDSLGRQIWDAVLGAEDDDLGWALEQAGHGYVVAGSSVRDGDEQGWLLKVDPS